jgi:hypothetical protein
VTGWEGGRPGAGWSYWEGIRDVRRGRNRGLPARFRPSRVSAGQCVSGAGGGRVQDAGSSGSAVPVCRTVHVEHGTAPLTSFDRGGRGRDFGPRPGLRRSARGRGDRVVERRREPSQPGNGRLFRRPRHPMKRHGRLHGRVSALPRPLGRPAYFFEQPRSRGG